MFIVLKLLNDGKNVNSFCYSERLKYIGMPRIVIASEAKLNREKGLIDHPNILLRTRTRKPHGLHPTN